jgi:uncharacterized delta-60 repeat protein
MFSPSRKSVAKRKRCAQSVVFERLEDRQLFNGGGLDTSYGTNGFSTQFFWSPAAVAVQGDGKSVVVGSFEGDIYVGRANTNGTPDHSFGGFGNVGTSFGSGEAAGASSVAIQPDGKILVAGSESDSNGSRWAFARYNPNGSLDTSFGHNGIETVSDYHGAEYVAKVQVLPNGKIIFAAERDNGHFFGIGSGVDMYVGRLLSNGALDNTFGDGDGSSSRDGFTQIDFSQDDYVSQLAVMPDGRIVVGGGEGDGYHEPWAFARLTPAGALDSSFGNGGKVSTEVPFGSSVAELNGMAVTADGQIYAAGLSNDSTIVGHYFSNGQLDTHFGTKGFAVLATQQTYSVPVAVFLPAPGKILVVSSLDDITAVQLLNDGTLDPSFGTNGRATINTAAATAGNTGLNANYFQATAVAETGTGYLMVAAQNSLNQPFTTLARVVEETPVFHATSSTTVFANGARYTTETVYRDQAYDFDSHVNVDTLTTPTTGNAGAMVRSNVAKVGVVPQGFYVDIPAGALSTTFHVYTPPTTTVTTPPTTVAHLLAQPVVTAPQDTVAPLKLVSTTASFFSDTAIA